MKITTYKVVEGVIREGEAWDAKVFSAKRAANGMIEVCVGDTNLLLSDGDMAQLHYFIAVIAGEFGFSLVIDQNDQSDSSGFPLPQ
jgi:hypothetical protein